MVAVSERVQRTTRAPRRGSSAARGALAFAACLAGLALLWPGCREIPPVEPRNPAPAGVLRWQAGDVFAFDTWQLTLQGGRIDSTQCVSIRRVLAAGVTVYGRGNVMMMLDSIAFRGRPVRLDTLYLYQDTGGDLWQYGLLASMGRRYLGVGVAPQWDRIAALSAGAGATWTVGALDTLGPVAGTLIQDPYYYTAVLNNIQVIFQPIRAELFNQAFGYTIMLSMSPPLFERVVEPSSTTLRGIYRELTSARLGTG